MIYLSILFLVLLMPLTLWMWCLVNCDKYVVPVVFSGVLAGAIVSMCISIFGSTYRLTEFSFMSNFTFLFLTIYFIPVVVVYAVFFLLTKDDVEFKLNCFFPLTVSFCSIFIPYMSVASSIDRFSFFAIFYRPALCVFMLMACSVFVNFFARELKGKKYFFAVIWIVLMLVHMVLPAVFDALWIFGAKLWLVYIFCFVYAAFTVFLVWKKDCLFALLNGNQ